MTHAELCTNSVAVLIPAHNAAGTIEAALESVQLQGAVIGEVIVVDDHSVDGLSDVVLSWSARNASLKLRLVTASQRGACYARNLAFRLSSCPVVQWLDADDVLGPGKVSEGLRLLSGNPHALVVAGWAPFNRFPGDQGVSRRRFGQGLMAPGEWMASCFHTVPGCWLGSRSLFLSSGGWDESLQINQDGDYLARVVSACSGVIIDSQSSVYYRASSSSSVSTLRSYKLPSYARSMFMIGHAASSVCSVDQALVLRSFLLQRALYQCARLDSWSVECQVLICSLRSLMGFTSRSDFPYWPIGARFVARVCSVRLALRLIRLRALLKT